VAWAVAAADPPEIDRLNIHQASLWAMQRAILALAPVPDIVLVDAFRVPELPMAQRGVLHGDRRCTAIAAASIVAKVTRDRLMLELHGRDPRPFDRHKGYATAITSTPSSGSVTPTRTGVRSGHQRLAVASGESCSVAIDRAAVLRNADCSGKASWMRLAEYCVVEDQPSDWNTLRSVICARRPDRPDRPAVREIADNLSGGGSCRRRRRSTRRS
jgi:hypothetical protein